MDYTEFPQTRVSLAGVGRGWPETLVKRAVRMAAEAATDFSWLSRGDALFIKPALNSGNPYPATTRPAAVAALVELLKEKGAGRVIVGDMSGIPFLKMTPKRLFGSTRRLMERCGMARAAQAAGAELHFFEEAGWNAFYEEAPLLGPHWKSGLMMPKVLKEVEHIILLPRCSRHALTGSTLGLKAAVGYWRTDTRLEYHQDAATLQEKTAEGNTVTTLLRKQRLVLSAADKILVTCGPNRGYVSRPETGLIIASESVVAHDMVSLAWLLKNRRHTPESAKGRILDPYNSQFLVTFVNGCVVGILGGCRPVLTSQKLIRNDLPTIWDDRALNRAYQLFGGIPRVFLQAANETLPEELKGQLTEMTTPAV
jgi:uncharacterized protein (DUF362 family)